MHKRIDPSKFDSNEYDLSLSYSIYAVEENYSYYKMHSKIFIDELKKSNMSVVEKWDLYCKFCEVNKNYSIYPRVFTFETLRKASVNIGYFMNNQRGEVIYFHELISEINENLKNGYYKEYEDACSMFSLIELMKEIIESGLTGCVYDW